MSLFQKPLSGTDDLFAPNYQQNIYRVLPTALRCMGVKVARDDLFDQPNVMKHLKQNQALSAERVIVCIIDSLGSQNVVGTKLETFLNDIDAVSLSSTFPTITSAAIPSINFGVPPTTHGILGHIIYFSEYGTLVDTLRMSGYKVRYRDAIPYAGIDVRSLLWNEGIPEIPQNSHPSLVVAEGLPREIPGTGLGRFYVQMHNIFSFNGIIDGFGMVRRVLDHFQNHPIFMTIYFPQIDNLTHKYGSNSHEYRAGCNDFHRHLQAFKESLPTSEAKHTTIVLCSDHGQNVLNDKKTIFLSQEQIEEVKGTLRVPPGHSGRVTHFYCQSTSKRRKLKQWLLAQVEDRALIYDAKDIDNAQLLPVPSSKRILQRLGDLLLIARDGVKLVVEREEDSSETWGLLPNQGFLANHGSLTADELLTPFAAFNAAEH
ncbi:MAG: alkaline phosphatase family protein [Promethearchaeota archaeon]